MNWSDLHIQNNTLIETQLSFGFHTSFYNTVQLQKKCQNSSGIYGGTGQQNCLPTLLLLLLSWMRLGGEQQEDQASRLPLD